MADHLLVAADKYRVGEGAERVHRTYWRKVHPGEPMHLPTHVASRGDAVYVTVNDSRWIVVCPNCGEGQLAAPDDHRFLCIMCLNAAVGGRWRLVIWPREAAGIEHELLKRPRFASRNWAPHETLKQLERETLAHVD